MRTARAARRRKTASPNWPGTANDLRDWEYITSEQRGRQRVHRIVWKNEVDKCFWAPTKRNDSSHGREPSDDDSSRLREGQFPFCGGIVPVSREKIGTSDSSDNDLGRRTYVLTEYLTYKKEGA